MHVLVRVLGSSVKYAAIFCMFAMNFYILLSKTDDAGDILDAIARFREIV